MAGIEQDHQDPLEKEIFTVTDRYPFCAVPQYRSTHDDPYDPREVVGEMVMVIDPEIIDDLHAAGVSLDRSAIDLVHLAQEKGLPRGDIIRDLFQGIVSQPASFGAPVTVEQLSGLSQRIASTPDKPKQIPTFTPFFGDDPLSLPSRLPPVLPTSFKGLLIPPSKQRPEPIMTAATNPLPDII